MEQLNVFNPVARSINVEIPKAKRLPTLDGKRIGLFWNFKAGGDIALRHVEEALKGRYPAATFSFHVGADGGYQAHLTTAQARQMADECDAVVGSTAD